MIGMQIFTSVETATRQLLRYQELSEKKQTNMKAIKGSLHDLIEWGAKEAKMEKEMEEKFLLWWSSHIQPNGTFKEPTPQEIYLQGRRDGQEEIEKLIKAKCRGCMLASCPTGGVDI